MRSGPPPALVTAGVTSPCSSACSVWDEGRIPVRERDGLGEDRHQARLRHAVRIERTAQVRPRDRRHDRLEGNAGDRRVPDLAAAEREAERPDLRVRDVAARRRTSRRGPARPARPSARRARTCRPEAPVPRASQASAAKPNCARARADRLHVRVRLAEPVEEDDSRPAAGRRGAARDDVRARERRRVRGVDRDLRSSRDAAEALPAQMSAAASMATTTRTRPTSRTLARHLRWAPWIRGP